MWLTKVWLLDKTHASLFPWALAASQILNKYHNDFFLFFKDYIPDTQIWWFSSVWALYLRNAYLSWFHIKRQCLNSNYRRMCLSCLFNIFFIPKINLFILFYSMPVFYRYQLIDRYWIFNCFCSFLLFLHFFYLCYHLTRS